MRTFVNKYYIDIFITLFFFLSLSHSTSHNHLPSSSLMSRASHGETDTSDCLVIRFSDDLEAVASVEYWSEGRSLGRQVTRKNDEVVWQLIVYRRTWCEV